MPNAQHNIPQNTSQNEGASAHSSMSYEIDAEWPEHDDIHFLNSSKHSLEWVAPSVNAVNNHYDLLEKIQFDAAHLHQLIKETFETKEVLKLLLEEQCGLTKDSNSLKHRLNTEIQGCEIFMQQIQALQNDIQNYQQSLRSNHDHHLLILQEAREKLDSTEQQEAFIKSKIGLTAELEQKLLHLLTLSETVKSDIDKQSAHVDVELENVKELREELKKSFEKKDEKEATVQEMIGKVDRSIHMLTGIESRALTLIEKSEARFVDIKQHYNVIEELKIKNENALRAMESATQLCVEQIVIIEENLKETKKINQENLLNKERILELAIQVQETREDVVQKIELFQEQNAEIATAVLQKVETIETTRHHVQEISQDVHDRLSSIEHIYQDSQDVIQKNKLLFQHLESMMLDINAQRTALQSLQEKQHLSLNQAVKQRNLSKALLSRAEEYDDKIVRQSENIDQATQKVRALIQQDIAIRDQVQNANRAIRSHEKLFKATQNKFGNLTDQCEKLQSATLDLQDQATQTHYASLELQRQLQRQSEAVDEKLSFLHKAEKRIQELLVITNNAEENQKNTQSLQKRIESLISEYKSQLQNLNNTESEYKNSIDRIVSVENRHEKIYQKVQNVLQELESFEAASSKRLMAVDTAIEKADDKIGQMDCKLKQFQYAEQQVGQIIQSFEDVCIKNTESVQEINQALDNFNKLKDRVNHSLASIEKSEIALNQKDKNIQQMKADLEKDLNSLHQVHASVQSALVSIQKESQSVRHLTEENRSSLSKFQLATQDLENIKQQSHGVLENIRQTFQRMDESTTWMNSLQQAINQDHQELSSLIVEWRRHETNTVAAHDEMAELRQKIEVGLAETRNKNSIITTKMVEMDQFKNYLDKALNETRFTITEQDAKTNSVVEQLNAARNLYDQTRSQMQNIQNIASETERNHQQLIQQLAQVDNYQKRAFQSHIEVQNYQKQLESGLNNFQSDREHIEKILAQFKSILINERQERAKDQQKIQELSTLNNSMMHEMKTMQTQNIELGQLIKEIQLNNRENNIARKENSFSEQEIELRNSRNSEIIAQSNNSRESTWKRLSITEDENLINTSDENVLLPDTSFNRDKVNNSIRPATRIRPNKGPTDFQSFRM